MSRPTPPAYKSRNWPAYNKALKRRGSLKILFDPGMTWEAAPTGKRGRKQDYSDAAIQTCPTIKVLFGMALRQIEPCRATDGVDGPINGIAMCHGGSVKARS